MVQVDVSDNRAPAEELRVLFLEDDRLRRDISPQIPVGVGERELRIAQPVAEEAYSIAPALAPERAALEWTIAEENGAPPGPIDIGRLVRFPDGQRLLAHSHITH